LIIPPLFLYFLPFCYPYILLHFKCFFLLLVYVIFKQPQHMPDIYSASALRDFEVVKKRWDRALLSEKRCCFVRKPAREVDAALS